MNEQAQSSTQPNKALELPTATFIKQVKDSMEILKDNHNKMAEKLNDVVQEINEMKEFLTYTNKWYRKFYYKKHLKTKFK